MGWIHECIKVCYDSFAKRRLLAYGGDYEMITDRPFKAKVLVRFVKREDGGLKAICDAVPGFYLSGSNPRDVLQDVAPTIEYLFQQNLKISVEVFPLEYAVYQITELEAFGLQAIPEQLDYLIEKRAA
jgi:hypothetical protein